MSQGKVSILAHSLGSVLCYEILCNQPHLFDHLEFNIPSGTPAPSDTSNAAVSFHKTQQSSASETQQQQPLKQQQQQHRQASTEIAFAPMSSRDLDNSSQAGKSCPDFPTPLAKSLPHTSATLGTAAGRKEIPQVRQKLSSTETLEVVSQECASAVCLLLKLSTVLGKHLSILLSVQKVPSQPLLASHMQACKFASPTVLLQMHLPVCWLDSTTAS